jgi:hypothetical protein
MINRGIRSRYENFPEKTREQIARTSNAGVIAVPSQVVRVRDAADPESAYNSQKRQREAEAAEKQRRIDAEAAEIAERRRIGEEKNRRLLEEEEARKQHAAQAAQARRTRQAAEAGFQLEVDMCTSMLRGYSIPASKRIVEISKEMGLAGTAVGTELAVIQYQREQAAESQKVALAKHKQALREGLVSQNPETGIWERIDTPLPDGPPSYQIVEEE